MINFFTYIFIFFSFLSLDLYSQQNEIILYYQNGLIKERFFVTREIKDYNNNSVIHGKYTSYYPSIRSNYKLYNKNQDLLVKETGQYKYGFKDGLWTEYYPPSLIHDSIIIGAIKTQGKYFGCQKIGKWKYYNIDGTIEEKVHRLSIRYTLGFYPCDFYFKESGLIRQIVEYDILSDCTIDNIKFNDPLGFGYDEAILFKSIKLQNIKKFYSYEPDTNDLGQISYERVHHIDKKSCLEEHIIDTINLNVNIGK